MNRRSFLNSMGTSVACVAAAALRTPDAVAQTSPHWRTFEVATTVELFDAAGVSRAWIPVPLLDETSYQQRLGDDWQGNARLVRVLRDEKYGAGFLYVEWNVREKIPRIELISRVRTRDRQVDVSGGWASGPEEEALARKLYLQPTVLVPIDGLVAEQARTIVRGLSSELAKAQAIYSWIVENTYRDPAVRGCGLGDVRLMLETQRLGGKCVDLNALFVALTRAAGIPARDVFGIRVADSQEFRSLGKSGDITRAQHCRAEFYLSGHGWVPVDPADVRKVMLEEPPGDRSLADPFVQRARAKLFGSWEMNYVVYNHARDV